VSGVACATVAGQIERAVVEGIEGRWSYLVGGKVAGLDIEAGWRGPCGLFGALSATLVYSRIKGKATSQRPQLTP